MHQIISKKCRILLLVAVLFLTACSKNKSTGQTLPPAAAPVFELQWLDDFTGQSLDTTHWYHRIPGVRFDGFNDTTSVSVINGNMCLKVYSDTVSAVLTHHTGMIATKQLFKYGKFEVKASFKNQSGSWSAYWLQSPTMGTPAGSPQTAGMEIDVVETLANDGTAHHNLHWDGYGANHKSAGLVTADYGINSGNYHVYTFEWTPTCYKFYVDGILTWTYTTNISQRSEYIILSSEVKNYAEGRWAGPIPNGGFGSKANTNTIMKVDYVKYYALK